MLRTIASLSAALALISTAGAAAPPTPDPAAEVKANSYPFSFEGGRLSGPGGEIMDRAAAGAQFVLIGESHYDHDTPLFALALYRQLHERRGFDHLVVELDVVAMQDINRRGVRGDAAAIANLAKRYPTLIGFSSDQDIELLAEVGKLEHGPEPIWGLEQVQGTTRYLEELVKLAHGKDLKARTQALYEAARANETGRKTPGNYLSDTPDSLAQMKDLQSAFHARPGSRADFLLTSLVKSAEIYSYYRRAEAGELVGLYNNTVREAWLKARFMDHYRQAQARGEPAPKAVFKFGDNHMYHGKNPTQAFPIGNFAHEFAISNDMGAFHIDVVPLGAYAKWSDVPDWMRPLLPPEPPKTPLLIDLRPLQPLQRLYRQQVPEADQWMLRDFINGYDAIVLLPDSRKADMTLTEFSNPF